jgi:hypothetical protein
MNRARKIPASLALATILLGLAASAARAGQQGWEPIGEKVVTDRVDHDTVVVTRAEGTFKAVQVRVKQRAVQFRSMKIHFGNGDTQNVELRVVIPAGGKSRVIDVEGGDRIIKTIDFVYDAQSLHGGTAVVRVFGRN